MKALREVLIFLGYCVLGWLLVLGVISLSTSIYKNYTVERLAPDLTEEVENVVLSYLDYPETATFSNPEISFTTGLIRFDGHVESKTDVRDEHDMLYTLVFMKQSENWVLVYATLGMRIYENSLTN